MAEVMGWRTSPLPFERHGTALSSPSGNVKVAWWHPDEAGCEWSPPDYHKDLNELRKARLSVLSSVVMVVGYLSYLRAAISRRTEKNKAGVPLVSDYDMINAEPGEHLEAILKAIGKWDDTK